MRIKPVWLVFLALFVAACGGSTTSGSTPPAATPTPVELTLSSTDQNGNLVGNGPQNPFHPIASVYVYSNGVKAQLAQGSVPGDGKGITVFIVDTSGNNSHSDFFPPFDSNGISTVTLISVTHTYVITITKKGGVYTILKIVQS